MTILPVAAVLPIFWTLPVIGPMTSVRGPGFAAAAFFCGPTLEYKESSHMKRAIFMLAAVGLLAGLAGCTCPGNGRWFSGLINGSCQNAPENCASCGATDGQAACDADDDGGCTGCRRGCRAHYAPPAPGPATGAITYPYYTTRGPRDFLARNPQSIGP